MEPQPPSEQKTKEAQPQKVKEKMPCGIRLRLYQEAGSFVRYIGIIRTAASSTPTCLVYNIFRYSQIYKYQSQLLSKRDDCILTTETASHMNRNHHCRVRIALRTLIT